MTVLIICILLNVLVSLIFKVFPNYKVDVLKAIIINYFVCVFTAAAAMNNIRFLTTLWVQPWLLWAMAMGILFFFVFLAIGKTVAHHGVMVATTSQKLSLILPVLVSFLFFKEQFTPLKLAGIVCAVGAVAAINYQSNISKSKVSGIIILLPLITWLGSSIVDLSLFLVERLDVSEGAGMEFTASLFLFAGLSGLIYLIFSGGGISIQRDKVSLLAGLAWAFPIFFPFTSSFTFLKLHGRALFCFRYLM
ncbi:MAG: hypothetical protein IPN29_12800 [Saprospiraceae bacterium]|nr:hypothetical protein [Saprospiraceae bacterium]